MPPVSSPNRRVLGDKDTNASLSIKSPRKSLTTSIDSRPAVQDQPGSRAFSKTITMVPPSPRAGQKRRITEVECVESQDWEGEIKASQTTDVVSDSASEIDPLDTSMLSAKSAADTTMTSFGMGANEEISVEQQFELFEPEMSQRTLDKIHAVTLPQNTSQPGQLRERPELIHNTSQESVGMSNFLNFHSDPSSQASDGLKMIDASTLPIEPRELKVERNQPLTNLSKEDERKAMMEEKATQLRTRLQLAFFKVETRQTNTPFARLKVPESRRRSTQSPPLLPPASVLFRRHQSYAVSASPNERTGFSPEARVAALRAQATMQHKPAVRSLNSLPMPDIKPTAFSARWADDMSSTHAHSHAAPPAASCQTDGNNDQPSEIPSSPPVSTHSLHIHEDETATVSRSRINSSTEAGKSPVLPAPKTPVVKSNANEQLSSPPPSQGEDNEDIDVSDAQSRPVSRSKEQLQPRERRLTSSVVKGEAASGLLQLMRSGVVNASNVRGPMCGL